MVITLSPAIDGCVCDDCTALIAFVVVAVIIVVVVVVVVIAVVPATLKMPSGNYAK